MKTTAFTLNAHLESGWDSCEVEDQRITESSEVIPFIPVTTQTQLSEIETIDGKASLRFAYSPTDSIDFTVLVKI